MIGCDGSTVSRGLPLTTTCGRDFDDHSDNDHEKEKTKDKDGGEDDENGAAQPDIGIL